MQTHKPPTLFRLFLSLLDLQTALPLLRTETAAPPTVANTFDGDESDEGSERRRRRRQRQQNRARAFPCLSIMSSATQSDRRSDPTSFVAYNC